MPALLLADRFVRSGSRWFDIATGDAVSLRIFAPLPRGARLEWAERCGALASLRHPLVNPLLDFGTADNSRLFEAYAALPPVPVERDARPRVVQHAVRLLEAHGVVLDRDTADVWLRQVIDAPRSRSRLIAHRLQPRRAAATIADVLDSASPAGMRSLSVTGAPGSGLRTLWRTAAHLARIRGYVPVAAAALRRWPELDEVVRGRFLCLLEDEEDGPALASLRFACGRSHVHLRFCRRDIHHTRFVKVEAMEISAMTNMVCADPETPADERALIEAARSAFGRPGAFLRALRALPFDPSPRQVMMVHETPGVYLPDSGSGRTRPARPRRRIASVVATAEQRAVALLGCRRHASAVRLLRRAARVFEGAGDATSAAGCMLRLGWLLRSRGKIEEAHATFARVRDLPSDPSQQVEAANGMAACATDLGKLDVAEAGLRSACAAAAAANAFEVRERSLLLLGRTLYWQGRYDEAAATLRIILSVALRADVLSLTSRLLLRVGDPAEAMRAAAAAVEHSAGLDDRTAQVRALRAIADVAAVVGRLDDVRRHVAAGVRLAGTLGLPLAAVKCRAALIRALVDAGPAGQSEAGRLTRRLGRAGGRLPHLLQLTIAAAARGMPRGDPRRPAVEEFLEVAHGAADDRAAVDRLLTAVAAALGCSSLAIAGAGSIGIVASCGRPWRERTLTLEQAIGGRSVITDPSEVPLEAAEPVRLSGEIIGAIGARWTAGHIAEASEPGLILRAAALAVAPHLGALLEARQPEPPAAAWGDLLGDSAAAADLRDAVLRAARAPFPVLIQGESGSGKELVAKAVHRLGARRDRKFCALNCAALADDLIEAELFGHARGAFTGAATERAGLFEEADGGTLFLDEIGELSPRAQAKLLRVLQDGEVRRVGENLPRRVDVRIVAATNRNLEEEAKAGRFRTDLRFRLDVIRIAVPPLRDRSADIPLLATHFWRDASARVGSAATLGPDAISALARYDWPGNVRELQNAIAWIAVHGPRRGRIGASCLPAQLARASAPLSGGSFEAAREDFERRFVRAALAQAGGQRAKAAKALGLSRQGLAKMLRRLGIAPDS
jgi:DNA-binding NtrC family response regulator/tetratricopeptide (TPR) repeat protein